MYTLFVYDLRTKNLNFIAPIPEQDGTTTIHFSEVSDFIVGPSTDPCGTPSGMGETNMNFKGPTDFRR